MDVLDLPQGVAVLDYVSRVSPALWGQIQSINQEAAHIGFEFIQLHVSEEYPFYGFF